MERETGFEPRAPHLGKVAPFVRLGLAGPLKRRSVHPVSDLSTVFALLSIEFLASDGQSTMSSDSGHTENGLRERMVT